jgi:dienelactone hydrolase
MKTNVKIHDTPFRNSLLVTPNDGETHPGIIFLHGAEGGGAPFWKMTALLYAAQGFASLAYCYFGRDDGLWGKRESLCNFELLELYEAMKWLKQSDSVKVGRIVISGASRGAELALLFGSLISSDDALIQPDAILAHCPSDKVYGSWNLDWEDERCWLKKEPQNPIRGQHPGPSSIWNPKCGQDPRDLPDDLKNAWKWRGQGISAGERIEVEKIRCPTFISHGVKDEIWPVEKTQKIEATMREHNLAPEVHYFDEEGHLLGRVSSEKRMELVLTFLDKYL